MTAIGITGPMGAGKTYILEHLTQRGYPVLSCDLLAKELMVKDDAIVQSLEAIVPEAYIKDERGTTLLNKPAIAAFLYNSEDNAERIDCIVHPRVTAYVQAWLANNEAKGCQLAFVESALLYAAGLNRMVDHILIITAEEELRLQRIAKRDRLDLAQIKQRLAMQDNSWQQHLNDPHTTHIENNGEDTLQQLQDFLHHITKA